MNTCVTRLIEPIAVTDVFSTELARVEKLRSGCVRFTFAVHQRPIDNGEEESVIVSRLVLPEIEIPSALATIMDELGMTCFDIKRREIPAKMH